MAKDPRTATIGPNVRLSYLHVLEPHAMKDGEEPMYSAALLLPKSDTASKEKLDAAVQAAKEQASKSKWGGKEPANIDVPIHDGDGLRQSGEPYGPEAKGCWVINAKTKQQPKVVDTSRQPIMDAEDIYSGMYAYVGVQAWGYDNSGRKGISFGLGHIMKTKDGERMAGGMSVDDTFADIDLPEDDFLN